MPAIQQEEPLTVSFSMIRVILFISELIQECLAMKKFLLGGRVDTRIGTAYVGIIGGLRSDFSLCDNGTALHLNQPLITEE